MDKKKSIASGSSTNVTVCRKATTKMVQNVVLIWLDDNIDEENNVDCRNTITQLRSVVNTINTFTDGDQCVQFIAKVKDEKICVIISGSLGKRIVPSIHTMTQVDSIFIFCGNKELHERWAKDWSKIKGVFTKISPICEALKQARHQCEQNSISISFVATGGDVFNKNLDQLDPSFMYTQILKDILLTIEFEQKHIQQFIDYCRNIFADNTEELVNVKELENKYFHKTPIWWYTYESFLYPMLNRALRLMDADIIIKMGFFIKDLHRHIEQLHSKQFNGHHTGKTFMVYRGQGMLKGNFDQMSKSIDGLMSFNNFLSTSKDRKLSLQFGRTALVNQDLVGILFVMTIDPSESTTPFASVNGISYFESEDEVLFSMHTVFRIRDIKPMDENHRLFQVNLTLTSDNDKDLRALTEHIRQETKESKGWFRLGVLLLKMGQFKKAQEVYEVMLDQTTDENEKGNIYDRLGAAKRNQGEYKEAIICFETSVKIYQKILPSNHPNLAVSFNNIGSVYYHMDEYSRALSYYEKALEIQQKSLSPNHAELAASYNNIGVTYKNMNENAKALSYYEKALEIQRQSLPPNHPDLAGYYNNIGLVFDQMGNYTKALSYYEKNLEINQKTLPPNHPNLAASYNNIGVTYQNMGEYSKARPFYERALDIGQHSLASNHPDLQMYKDNLDLVKE